MHEDPRKVSKLLERRVEGKFLTADKVGDGIAKLKIQRIEASQDIGTQCIKR
jgi:uncharacterized protein (DUF2249 family)